MKSLDVALARLSNQSLGKKRFKKPDEVVAWLGAVQAQDFAAAKCALGLRMQKATDADVEQAFNDGGFLRTHVMRPTWHFVMPEDIRWMLELTAPRVKAVLAHYDRMLEIDRKLIQKSNAVFAKALQGNNYLTRAELADALEKNKIKARGQRLGRIVMHAELDAVLCSGPRLGKQFSYALLKERAPKAKRLERNEALATLAGKYFKSHGPAQLKDFAWWSGLTLQDAQRGLEVASGGLVHETIDSKTHWFSPETKTLKLKSPTAWLLSIYDEYTIAYKDRSALGQYVEKLLPMGNALTSVLVLDGKVAGTWKRVLKKERVEMRVKPLRELSKAEHQAIKAAANGYGKFLEMPVHYG